MPICSYYASAHGLHINSKTFKRIKISLVRPEYFYKYISDSSLSMKCNVYMQLQIANI